MGERIIVLDIAIPAFLGNRILDAAFAARFPGGSVWPLFAQKAEARGWRVMTADLFLNREISPSVASCVSNEGHPATIAALTRRRVKMAVIWSGESPNVAWDFYHGLAERARPFRHAFVFRGFHSRLPQGVERHAFCWPNSARRVAGPPWEKRGLAVMVVSVKQRIGVNYARRLSRLAWGWRWLKIRRIQLVDPMLRFPDLYETRIQAVENLAPRSGFRLFGGGWQAARRHNGRIGRILFARDPEECEDKLATISNYRFTVCLENCEYPGYLTEKIFDAMLAGTVPVYLGAPDIVDYIPRGCFIDVREYRDWDALWQRLAAMTRVEWQSWRHAIEGFLASPEYRVFDEERIAGSFANLATTQSE
jgi:hypothetical protein